MKDLFKDKKKLAIVLIIAVAVIVFAVVAVVAVTTKKDDEKEAKAPTKQEENHENEMRSLLTGEWISKDLGTKRAVAIMTENTKDALPQYGLNSASVIYEVPVEGSITRLMAIYEDYADLERIGNVRSCRPYYVHFASEFDAIYVHYGQSVHGEQLLNTGIVDNLSGLDGSLNAMFYRTNDRKAPHNAYTSGEGITSGIEKKSYRKTYKEDFKGHYLFATEKENTLSAGTACDTIKPYYFYNQPSFVYDAETKLYQRFQFGKEEIDAVDGEQICVSNVIFQNVSGSMYESTPYLNLTVSGSGEGKFFTRGKMIDITWEKEADGITHYYDYTGEEIVLNPGKTWVCIIQKEYADDNGFIVVD